MKKYVFFLLLAFSLQAKAQRSLYRSIDSLMQSMDKEGFSGVLLVAAKGKLKYEKAFGYRRFAPAQVLKRTDIFELASVSKQFTAMVIMMLREKGLLQYEDKVEKYLDIPYKGITIRHLLTHTGGLPDYQVIMDQYWDKQKVAGNPDILEYLNRYAPPALFTPGARFNYSNTGYVLLASIAEKAGGKDFIDQCREQIFKPLKMKHTAIRTAETKAATENFAIGHIYVAEKKQYVRADSFPSFDYTIWLGNRKGPGRISSTAGDLLKWDRALYTEKLVSRATLDEAFMPMQLNDGSYSDYGFGWEVIPSGPAGKTVMHSGGNPGYKTQIIRYTDQQKTIILLCNNEHERFEWLLGELKKKLVAVN